jgi:hypothetical protein
MMVSEDHYHNKKVTYKGHQVYCRKWQEEEDLEFFRGAKSLKNKLRNHRLVCFLHSVQYDLLRCKELVNYRYLE